MIASSAKTPFPLGAYLNAPDGSNAFNQAEFQTNYDSFTALMGISPSFLDYYGDYNQQVSSWISQSSWQAWSASLSPQATAATPVIALPMYSLVAGSLTPDQQYQAIISGQDDAVISGVLMAWVDQGFKNLVFRPGWEMNIPGNTYAGDSAQEQSDWVAAFQRIYMVLHQTATAAGVSVSVIWNPSTTNYSNAQATTNLYPGDAYVDAIGADVYADMWPYSDTTDGAPLYHDWDTGGEDTSIAQFIANPINRTHYWSYPAATKWALDSSGGHSQSFLSLIQFAEQHGKPFAIPETGAGNGQDVNDDGAFPIWLAAQLTAAQATGVTIQYVNLWDSNGGGNYEFSNASDGKPQEAAAFAAAFGVQTTTPTPTPAPTPAPIFTPSANNTVVTGTSAAITDANGNKWTITSNAQVAANGTTDTSTAGVIELAYVNGTIWQENVYQSWYGTTGINAPWGPGAGTTSPLPATPTPTPAPTPTPTPAPTSTTSANNTVVTGTSAAITDASGNKWTITSNAQVAVNGTTDTSTAGVIELAYVNGTIWQGGSSNVWWGTTQPNSAWGPSIGSPNPLPAPIILNSSTNTVSDSQVSIVATSGTRMLFLSGSGDIVNLSGGAYTITDTGKANTYILPAAGYGTDTFTTNILANGDMLDLQIAMAATDWNGVASTLPSYLKVSTTADEATLYIAPTSGGTGVMLATIEGAGSVTLASWLAHSFT